MQQATKITKYKRLKTKNLTHPLDKANQRPVVTQFRQTMTCWYPHKETYEKMDTTIDAYNNQIQSENN